MGSAFVAPGTNAAEGQENQQHQAGTISSNLLSSYAPYVQSQINYQTSQLPTAENAVSNLGQFTTQGGRNMLSQAFSQNARGQAQMQASQAPGQFAGNPALSQAFGIGAYNSANQSANQYDQQINSVQGEAQADQSYLNGLQSLSPNFAGISSLTANINGQPKVQVGQGLLGTLSQLAAPAASIYSTSLHH